MYEHSLVGGAAPRTPARRVATLWGTALKLRVPSFLYRLARVTRTRRKEYFEPDKYTAQPPFLADDWPHRW